MAEGLKGRFPKLSVISSQFSVVSWLLATAVVSARSPLTTDDRRLMTEYFGILPSGRSRDALSEPYRPTAQRLDSAHLAPYAKSLAQIRLALT